jgi:hypothetical protein
MFTEFAKQYARLYTIPFRMTTAIFNECVRSMQEQKHNKTRLCCSKCGKPADLYLQESWLFTPESICGECLEKQQSGYYYFEPEQC